MNSKLNVAIAVLLLSATVIQISQCVIFTVGGLLLDSTIAFGLFGKFLNVFHALGKRDIPQFQSSNWSPASPEQYLAVAASVDTDRCLPLAVCVAMAKSKDVNSQRNQFDQLVIDTFQKKIKEAFSGAADRVSPLAYYVEAAKFGQTVGVPDKCRLVSPSCKYSMEELSQLTKAAAV